jgi:hypothetical protein
MSSPIVLQVQGDAYGQPAHISAIVWDGATTSGDRVVLRHLGTHELLWQGRTDGTQTYLGVSWARGLSAPRGFYADVLMNGMVMVYLQENG